MVQMTPSTGPPVRRRLGRNGGRAACRCTRARLHLAQSFPRRGRSAGAEPVACALLRLARTFGVGGELDARDLLELLAREDRKPSHSHDPIAKLHTGIDAGLMVTSADVRARLRLDAVLP